MDELKRGVRIIGASVGTLFGLAGALAVGGGLVYFLDSENGGRRRRRVMDEAERAGHFAAQAGARGVRGAASVARGLGERVGPYVRAAHEAHSAVLDAAGEAVGGATERAREIGREFSAGTECGVEQARHALGSVFHRIGEWFVPRSRSGRYFSAGTELAAAVGLVGIAAAGTLLLDPRSGGERRRWIYRKSVRVVNQVGRFVESTAFTVYHRTLGFGAMVRRTLIQGALPDEKILGRIRAGLGRLVDRPARVAVEVREGCVYLRGSIERAEMAGLVDFIVSIAGVNRIENRLADHQMGGNRFEDDLNKRMKRGGRSLRPVARAASGVTGGALAVTGLVRRDLLGLGIAAAGIGLLARASVGPFVSRMSFGGGRGREEAGVIRSMEAVRI